MAHLKKDEVRARYKYCCGYCGVSETDVGGELTVDHFVPLSQGGDDSIENLVYCCIRCNQYKGRLSPNHLTKSLRELLLHPQLDDFDAHFYEDTPSGLLIHKTERGKSHIIALHLNREALVAHRLDKQIRTEEKKLLGEVLRENEFLRAQIEKLYDYLSIVESRQKQQGRDDE